MLYKLQNYVINLCEILNFYYLNSFYMTNVGRL